MAEAAENPANASIADILLSTQLRSFRERCRSPESCRCGDRRIRFGVMTEIGPVADWLVLYVDR